MGPACAAQLKFDAAGPIVPWWESYILQVDHDFGRAGISFAPEILMRQYHWEGISKGDTAEVMSMHGLGAWVGVHAHPFDAPRWAGIKTGLYGRMRAFRYEVRSIEDKTELQQEVVSWAAGGEMAWTFHPTSHLVLEPYGRVGLAYIDPGYQGVVPSVNRSEFQYEWDPDVRVGLFVGWDFEGLADRN